MKKIKEDPTNKNLQHPGNTSGAEPIFSGQYVPLLTMRGSAKLSGSLKSPFLEKNISPHPSTSLLALNYCETIAPYGGKGNQRNNLFKLRSNTENLGVTANGIYVEEGERGRQKRMKEKRKQKQ